MSFNVILSVGFLTNYWVIYIRFKPCRLNYHYDFIFKKCFIFIFLFSLTHIILGNKEREREFLANSSLFICLVLPENHEMIQEVSNKNLVGIEWGFIDFPINLLSFLNVVVIVTMD